MRRIFGRAGIAGLVMVGGCASVSNPQGDKDQRDQSTEYWSSGYGVKALTLDSKGAAMTLRKAIEIDPNDPKSQGIVDHACFNIPVGSGKETECQQQRNAAMATLLAASGDLCQEHLKSIYGQEAYYNVLTGSVATFFSGAAAIAGGGSAKSALAAISTFANAERSLLNETIYKNMLVTATSKKIRETRDTKAAAMIPGSLKKPIDEYPMVLAIRDVVDYHYSCSFMLGLEKALEEGVQGNTDNKRAKLELEKRGLELYIDNRTATLAGAGRSADVAGDKGISGAKSRIEAIETLLLALVNSQGGNAAGGDKGADAGPPKADPAALSKAYYALAAAIESGKAALEAKINAASPANQRPAIPPAAYTGVTAALAAQTCEANMNAHNGKVAAKQGALAVASGNDKVKLGDELDALLIQSGRFVSRLGAFQTLYTTTLEAQGKAIDAANSALTAPLKAQVEGALGGIAVPAGLCAI